MGNSRGGDDRRYQIGDHGEDCLARDISSDQAVFGQTSAMGAPVSLQRILLGTFGAIAFLSFMENAIYLMAMARMRRRSQRHTSSNPPEWPTEGSAYHTGIPPWLEPMAVNSTH